MRLLLALSVVHFHPPTKWGGGTVFKLPPRGNPKGGAAPLCVVRGFSKGANRNAPFALSFPYFFGVKEIWPPEGVLSRNERETGFGEYVLFTRQNRNGFGKTCPFAQGSL